MEMVAAVMAVTEASSAAGLVALIAGAEVAERISAQAVDGALLDRLLAAAAPRGTPSPGHLVVVTGAELARLITQLSVSLARQWQLGVARARSLGPEEVLAAPVWVLALSRLPASEGLEGPTAMMAALQNLVLLARAHGLACHRVNGPTLVPETVTDLLAEHVGSELRGSELIAALALGHVDHGVHAPGGPEHGHEHGRGHGHAHGHGGVAEAALWIGDAGHPLRAPSRVPAEASTPAPTPVLRAQRSERVHIVDPLPHNRDEAARHLTAAGYQTRVFGDGQALLASLGEAGAGPGPEPGEGGALEPDLFVISDVLPDLSGFELVRRLRATPHGAGPILMTTARRDSAFRIGGLTAGVHYYLRRPINPIELLTAVRILLDRRRLVAELSRLNAFQDALLSAMQDVGVIALEPSLRIRYLTPGMARMVGYREDELIGRFPMELADGLAAIAERTAEGGLGAAGGTGRSDLRVRRKDGSLFDAELFRSTIRAPGDGATTGYLGVVVDITARKAAEREAARANDELTRLLGELRAAQARLVQQAKLASLGQLMAGVAHEINTPLGAVVSNEDLFQRCFVRLRAALAGSALAAEPVIARDLEAIDDLIGVNRTACTRITNIVRELRVFARLDEAAPQPVDVHECLESTLLLVGHLAKGRVELVRAYAQALPPVEGHSSQLGQVFMNLVVNACQAIEGPGQVVLATSLDGDWVRVEVRDSGPGIRPEHLGRIFDPGFTTKGAGVGTGLGLSICYQIVAAHGGEILVDSPPGQGACFTVLLPRLASPETA